MDTTLQAEPRTVLGKKVKQLRHQGVVPANLYGRGRESVPLQLPQKVVATRVARASASTLFSLEVDGSEPHMVLVKAIQRHPTSGHVLHVDLYQVAMSEKLKASVPLHFVGEAPAVREFSGTLLHQLTSVEVQSLPSDLPQMLEVDVSSLVTLEDTIHVRDIVAPARVEILTPEDEVVSKVAPPAVEEEVEAAPAEEAVEATDAAAEGEAPTAESEGPAAE